MHETGFQNGFYLFVMKKNVLTYLLLIISTTMFSSNNYFQFTTLPDLPPNSGYTTQPGLAGPYTGIDDNVLIVAGGANFPMVYCFPTSCRNIRIADCRYFCGSHEQPEQQHEFSRNGLCNRYTLPFWVEQKEK